VMERAGGIIDGRRSSFPNAKPGAHSPLLSLPGTDWAAVIICF